MNIENRWSIASYLLATLVAEKASDGIFFPLSILVGGSTSLLQFTCYSTSTDVVKHSRAIAVEHNTIFRKPESLNSVIIDDTEANLDIDNSYQVERIPSV